MESRTRSNKVIFEEINVLRAVAIILVVLGHSFIGTESNTVLMNFIIKVIYSFHMPIFFFISGFLAIKILNLKSIEEKKVFLKKKFYELMIPYLIVTLLALPVKILMSSFVKRPIVLKEFLVDLIFFPNKNPVAALWFIYTLFLIFVIVVISNKIKLKNMIYISLALILLSSFVKLEFMNFYGVFRNLIFFYLGLWYRKNYNYKKYINLSVFLISFVVIIVINLIPTQNEILYIITGISGIVLSYYIANTIKNYNTGLNKILNIINNYALPIYLFSWFTQNCVGYTFYKILDLNYTFTIVVTFIAGFIPIIIAKYILRRSKLLYSLFR